MGIIRKTMSISTLGLVRWRSKNDRLDEATADLELTKSDLEQVSKKHALVVERLSEAEQRAEQAELAALRDARSARRRGRREARAKLGRRRMLLGSLHDAVDPAVEGTRNAGHRLAADVEPAVDDAVSGIRKRGRKARAAADTKAKRFRDRSRKTARRARKRGSDLRDRATDAAGDAAEAVRGKADKLGPS